MTGKLVRRPLRGSILEPTDFFGDFDRMLAGFLRPLSGHAEGWMPPADLRESDSAYIIEAELPGVQKDDVELTYEDGVLTFSGERKFESAEDNKNYHRIERSYGTFSRSFSLPQDVSQEKVVAQFENGLLTISLPKSEAIKPRKIEIG